MLITMASKVRARNLVADLHSRELMMLLVLIFFTFSFSFACAKVDFSSSHGEEKKWSVDHHAVVKGRVFCDPCLHHQFPSDTAHFLPGAVVAVECSTINNRKLRITILSNKAETDEYGAFRVEIPSGIHNLNLNPITSCSVRLLNSPHQSCNIPSISTSSLITPSNASGLETIYTSAPLSYRLQDIPDSLCTSSEEEVIISSGPRGRTLKESSSNFKAVFTTPTALLPCSIPPLAFHLPKLSVPPLPNVPPLPKLNFPPLNTPNLPPLNLPNAPPLNTPKFTVPPLPSVTIPPLPKLPVPPLNVPNLPPLNLPSSPAVNTPPLRVPPLPSLTVPPLPKLSFPTPPSPSTSNQKP